MRCWRRASAGEGIALNFSSSLIWRAAEDGVKPKMLSSEKVGMPLASIKTESRSKKYLRVIGPPIQSCRARHYSAPRAGVTLRSPVTIARRILEAAPGKSHRDSRKRQTCRIRAPEIRTSPALIQKALHTETASTRLLKFRSIHQHRLQILPLQNSLQVRRHPPHQKMAVRHDPVPDKGGRLLLRDLMHAQEISAHFL